MIHIISAKDEAWCVTGSWLLLCLPKGNLSDLLCSKMFAYWNLDVLESFAESLSISYQTGKLVLQMKLELDLMPAKSHIWMVRVSICKSLTGIRKLIATCSNYLLSAALNTSSIKDKLQYLNCFLSVVFQGKKKPKSVFKVSYKVSDIKNYSRFAFLWFSA